MVVVVVVVVVHVVARPMMENTVVIVIHVGILGLTPGTGLVPGEVAGVPENDAALPGVDDAKRVSTMNAAPRASFFTPCMMRFLSLV
jgi:hypothetical protein